MSITLIIIIIIIIIFIAFLPRGAGGFILPRKDDVKP